MRQEPRWVRKAAVTLLQLQTVYEKGGEQGIRDDGLLDSALARPHNLFAYAEPDLIDLAASYAFGLAKNHAFIDGNKRISFIVTELFLVLNGLDLIGSDDEAIVTWEGLAAGEVSEAELVAWLRERVVAVG